MNLYLCQTLKNEDKVGSVAFGVVRAESEKQAAGLFVIGLREDRLEEDVTYAYVRVHFIYTNESTEPETLKVEMKDAKTFHREEL